LRLKNEMSFYARFYVISSMHWLKFILSRAVAVAVARAKGEGREILQEKAP
jgi:hypothetical protein